MTLYVSCLAYLFLNLRLKHIPMGREGRGYTSKRTEIGRSKPSEPGERRDRWWLGVAKPAEVSWGEGGGKVAAGWVVGGRGSSGGGRRPVAVGFGGRWRREREARGWGRRRVWICGLLGDEVRTEQVAIFIGEYEFISTIAKLRSDVRT
jgi:hypothetical protein